MTEQEENNTFTIALQRLLQDSGTARSSLRAVLQSDDPVSQSHQILELVRATQPLVKTLEFETILSCYIAMLDGQALRIAVLGMIEDVTKRSTRR